VKDHIEHEINHFHRGKAHTSPDAEEDIARLQSSFHQSKIHINTPGRKLGDRDKVKDFMAAGMEGKKMTGMMRRWVDGRISSWSTQEEWFSEGDDN
jgi:hypothetical protein